MKRILQYIYVAIGVYVIYYVSSVIIDINLISLKKQIDSIGFATILICLSMYLMSHAVRVIRLAVIINQDDVSLRKLFKAQYLTNGINLVIPFKLGEVYRVVEYNKIIKDPMKSTLVILSERVIDFIVIFSFLIFTLHEFKKLPTEMNFLMVSGVCFIIVTLFVYFILPENLTSVMIFIVKKYNSSFSVKILKLMENIYSMINNIKKLFRRKMTTIILLSLLIWGCELSVFYYVTEFISNVHLIILLGLLVFLSSLIPSGPLGYGGLQLAFYYISEMIKVPNFIELSIIYQIFIFLPAVLICLFIYAFDIIIKGDK